MEDNGFNLTDTLQYNPSKTCHEIKFFNRMGCPIYIRFTMYDVTVVGDYGCWVFRGNIVNCYLFFRGDHTKPDYWEEKLEAAPRSHYERTVDAEELRKALLDEYPEEIKEEDLDRLESDRDTLESWYDTVMELNDSKGWGIETEYLYSTLTSCIVKDQLYLRVCELVQYAANYLHDQGVYSAED